MGAIYLKHPVHGEKVACSDIEAKADRENGWVDFDPTIPSFLSPASGSDEEDDEDEDDEDEEDEPAPVPAKPQAKAAPVKAEPKVK